MLGIVSNNNNFCEDVVSRLELDKYFDVIILSHKSKCRKPDPKIYKLCLKKLGVAAEETIFVGDNLDKDFKVPQSLGMQAILFDPMKRNLSVRKRIESLKELI